MVAAASSSDLGATSVVRSISRPMVSRRTSATSPRVTTVEQTPARPLDGGRRLDVEHNVAQVATADVLVVGLVVLRRGSPTCGRGGASCGAPLCHRWSCPSCRSTTVPLDDSFLSRAYSCPWAASSWRSRLHRPQPRDALPRIAQFTGSFPAAGWRAGGGA